MFKGLSYFSVFLIIFLAPAVFAQNCDEESLDSLANLANSGKVEGSEKIDLWNQIAKCYLDIDLDSTAYYAEKAKYFSTEIDYKKGLAVSTLLLARFEYNLKNYDQAITLFKKVIELYEGLEKDQNYLWTLNLTGVVYEIRQDFDQALDYYLTGLREAKLQGNKHYIASFYNNVSIIYSMTGFYDKQLIYIKKASNMFNELGHDKYYANSLVNIGICYRSQKQPDTALFYFHKAEKLQKKINNYYALASIYGVLGDISLEKNQPNEALKFYQESLLNATLLDSLDFDRNNTISEANISIGDLLLKQDKFSIAKEYYNKAFSSGKQQQSLLHQKAGSYGLFSCFFGLNQHDSAMFYHNIFLAFNDSLVAETYNERIDELNYEYELEKEKAIHDMSMKTLESEKENQRLWFIAILGFLFSLILLLFIAWYYQKTKLKQARLKRNYLELGRKQLQKELEYKNRELTTNVMYLLKKNEFIADISDKLKYAGSNADPLTNKIISDVIRDMDRSIVKDAWEEFEARFNEVHVEFYDRLNEKHPKLSLNELRLCAFLRLNMSSKEIASITFRSFQSIKVARYRLRKSLGLHQSENLVKYLSRF